MKSALTLLFFAFCLHLGMNAQVPKKVLLEEINGAWCGRVPFGDWIIDNSILPNYPNVIPVMLHYGTTTSNNQSRYDLLSNTFSDSIIHAFYVGVPHPAPQSLIDRTKFSGETNTVVDRPNDYSLTNNPWKNHVVSRLATESPVAVAINGTYDNQTRTLSATVNANFVAVATGDMRINLWIVEDNVAGSGYGFDQHTYDYNNPQSPFYQVGVQGINKDSIPGYLHRHVLRGGASPAWGTTGVIPSSVIAGQIFSANYAYAIPAGWNENNLQLVAFVSTFGTSQTNHSVLNAEQVSLINLTTGISSPPSLVSNTFVYPNPSYGKTFVEFSLDRPTTTTISISNILGEEMVVVAAGFLANGKHQVPFDASQLQNGLYLIGIKTESGETSTVQLLVIK